MKALRWVEDPEAHYWAPRFEHYVYRQGNTLLAGTRWQCRCGRSSYTIKRVREHAHRVHGIYTTGQWLHYLYVDFRLYTYDHPEIFGEDGGRVGVLERVPS